MENPFYGNYWSQPAHPRYSSNLRGIKPASKVVQIPVHFVSSDPERSVSSYPTRKPEPDRSGSVLRIQKVFRGFLVRQSVKKVMSIRKEVEDIEWKLLCSEKAEFIRRDEKERLRLNETLMSLLFKLDSVRGVDFGVRQLRKGVIRKAIYLQEKIDSIVAAEEEKIDSIVAAEEEKPCNDSSEPVIQANQSDIYDPIKSVDTENQAALNYTTNDEKTTAESEHCQTNQGDIYDPMEQSVDVENQAAPNYMTNDEKTTIEGSIVKCEELQEVKEECIEGVVDENEKRELEESRRNRELLEKMVEKNEKMMRMMNELCQRNEVQTRMLNSLTQRVDQLEKVFICDRLKTKKKKNRHPA